jgi:5-methyltetrahydrofolate--homocysteine methyltransferase
MSVEKAAPSVASLETSPRPPDLRMHVLQDYDLDEIFGYINPQMLYVRHLGYRGRFWESLRNDETKAVELRRQVQRVEDIMLSRSDITANAVFKFFPCRSEGQSMIVYEADGTTELERIYFGRQQGKDGLCLADYVRPAGDGPNDYMAMFVTTVSPGVRELSERWKDNGRYLDSHTLQALAIESAEGFAELLHKRIRSMWNIGEPSGLKVKGEEELRDLFRANYRGKRYSFGYPACPRLEDQDKLFRLLDVTGNIGVELTDGYMMDPEGSVSAVVFHHPDAKYFNLDEADIERLELEIAALPASER